MNTRRLFLIFVVLCFLCPISSHALTVYVDPPAPTDVDTVQIVALGCMWGLGDFPCGSYDYFSLSQLDPHTFSVLAVNNYGEYCYDNGFCITCEVCLWETTIGQAAVGVLPVGHYLVDVNGDTGLTFSFDVTPTPTGVHNPAASATHLSVLPNPFATSASIQFAMTKRSRATLEVFDVRGVRVRTLADETVDAPGSMVQWDGRDASGRRQPSGVYFARLSLDGAAVETRRIVLLR